MTPTREEIIAELERRKAAAPASAKPAPVQAAPKAPNPAADAIKAELQKRGVPVPQGNIHPLAMVTANAQQLAAQNAPTMLMLKPEARTVENMQRGASAPAPGAPFMTAAQRKQLDNERTFGQDPVDRAAVEQAILDKQQNSPDGRKARREAAAAYGAGSDFIQTVDAGGNTRPSGPTDTINYDLQKGMTASPANVVNGVSDAGQAAINLPGDIQQSLTGDRLIPKVDLPEIPLAPELQSISGDLTRMMTQWLATRGIIGKIAPGGGPIADRAKDMASTYVGFDADTPRMTEMVNEFVQQSGSPEIAKSFIGWMAERDPNNPALERFKNVLDFILPDEAIRAGGKVARAVDRAITGPTMTPTSAGAARPGPINTAAVEPRQITAVPPTAPRPQPAPVATQAPPAGPSVAPVAQPSVAQGPGRGAQAGATSAGQGGGAAQPVLNATPRAAVSAEDKAIARDTTKAIGRFMRGARIPRNLVDNYTSSLLGRFEVLKSDRYPLAFFIEEDLPQFLQQSGYSAADARNVAGDVAAKTEGWGKAANSFNASGNSSRYTMNNTIHQLTTTQKGELEATFRQVLGDESLIGRSDEIGALMRQNGEVAYNNSIAEANRVLGDGTATEAQTKAAKELNAILQNRGFSEFYPDTLQVEAATRGKTVDELIQERIAADPIDTAHWLQSKLGEAERQARNVDGSPTNMSVAYGDMRKAILDRLEKFDGYKGARMQHGDLWGADDAISFGDRFINTARSEYKTELMAREFAALSPRQQEVAALSIRDALLNPLLRGSPEDAAARITQLQNEGTLKALTTVLGPERGEVLRDAISSTRLENQRIARISQAHGSPTHLNQQGAKDAIDNLRGPGNRLAHAAGNPAGWGTAIGLDLLGGHGVFTGAKMAGSVFDRMTTPGRKFQSRVTKGLFGLPAADEAVAALPAPDLPTPPTNAFNREPPGIPPVGGGRNQLDFQPRPRATRPPPTVDEWAARIRKDQDELQRLLRQYDKIDRAAPNVDDLMRDNLHKQRLAKRRIADKTKKMEAARAVQPEPAPANAPKIEPPTNAFNATEAASETGAPTTPPNRNGFNQTNASPTASGIVVGGALGAMAPAENDQQRARNALIGAGVVGAGGALAGRYGSGRKAPRPVATKGNKLAEAGPRPVPPSRPIPPGGVGDAAMAGAPRGQVIDVDTRSIAHAPDSVRVIKNPSKRDLARLSVLPPEDRAALGGERTTSLRYIHDENGDMYVWRGDIAIHDDIIKALGVRANDGGPRGQGGMIQMRKGEPYFDGKLIDMDEVDDAVPTPPAPIQKMGYDGGSAKNPGGISPRGSSADAAASTNSSAFRSTPRGDLGTLSTPRSKLQVDEWRPNHRTVWVQGKVSENPRGFFIDENGQAILETRAPVDTSQYLNNAKLEWLKPMGEDVYVRVSDNPKDADFLIRGEHKGSKNWATGEAEGGLSVYREPYPGAGKYGVFVTGKRIGTGSDGEPLLDVSSVKALTPRLDGDALAAEVQKRLTVRLNELGLTQQEYRDLYNTRIKTAWEFSGNSGTQPAKNGLTPSMDEAPHARWRRESPAQSNASPEIAAGVGSAGVAAMQDPDTDHDGVVSEEERLAHNASIGSSLLAGTMGAHVIKRGAQHVMGRQPRRLYRGEAVDDAYRPAKHGEYYSPNRKLAARYAAGEDGYAGHSAGERRLVERDVQFSKPLRAKSLHDVVAKLGLSAREVAAYSTRHGISYNEAVAKLASEAGYDGLIIKAGSADEIVVLGNPDDQQIIRFGGSNSESRNIRSNGFGSGGKGAPLSKGIPKTKQPYSPKVIAEVDRLKARLGPAQLAKLQENALLPEASRETAMAASGNDPIMFSAATRAQQAAAPKKVLGVVSRRDNSTFNAGLKNALAEAGRPVEPKPYQDALSRKAEVAGDETANARKANSAESRAYGKGRRGDDIKPMVQERIKADRYAAQARSRLADARIRLESVNDVNDQIARKVSQIQDELNARPDLRDFTDLERKQMAQLLFSEAHSKTLADVLSGRMELKPGTPQQTALQVAALGGVTLAGGALVLSYADGMERQKRRLTDEALSSDWYFPDPIETKKIQRTLKALKRSNGEPYYSGAIDGDYGPGTMVAVGIFADDVGLQSGGKKGLSNQILAELRARYQ